MILAGIDPGADGAIALVDTKLCPLGTVAGMSIHDMPMLQLGKTRKRTLDFHQLAAILSGGIGHAFVEKTWNRPGEGHSGALVGCYMAILATLATAGVPWTPIAPTVWKKALGVPAAKDGARARASQLMPDCAIQWPLKKHDGRAEAALLCLYGVGSLK